MRFALILLLIAGCSALITMLLHKIKVRWIKYIPTLILFLFAVGMVIKAQNGLGEGIQDLAWIVVAILLFAGAVGGAITAMILDIMFLKSQKMNDVPRKVKGVND